jgi:hypothetical protein
MRKLACPVCLSDNVKTTPEVGGEPRESLTIVIEEELFESLIPVLKAAR